VVLVPVVLVAVPVPVDEAVEWVPVLPAVVVVAVAVECEPVEPAVVMCEPVVPVVTCEPVVPELVLVAVVRCRPVVPDVPADVPLPLVEEKVWLPEVPVPDDAAVITCDGDWVEPHPTASSARTQLLFKFRGIALSDQGRNKTRFKAKRSPLPPGLSGCVDNF
jgi:hypothetical protein